MDTNIGFRIPQKEKQLVVKVCRARGEDVSSFVRRSVKRELARLSFLTDDEKKALEVA